ncbi:MAG TPA: hypothetical protein VFQ95_08035, partial [Rhodanobacteraceae bacterium]|nr:hypothetical protein [Rhodanobacteraceae bacterium]
MATFEGHPAHIDAKTWGVMVEGEGFEAVQPGDTVHVKSKGGKTWDATVSVVLELTPWGARCKTRIGTAATTTATPAPATAPAPASVP